MTLLVKMLRKRVWLVFISICASVFCSLVTLWWNAQLSDMINTVSNGNIIDKNCIVLGITTILISAALAYAKTVISGFTCESMTHDLRMGYADHFVSLPVMEAEALSVGEQLSRLQNEISDVSVYLNSNLFSLVDDSIKFITTFIWLMIISPTLTISSNLPVAFIIIYVIWSSKTISAATEKSLQAKGKMNEYADTLLNLFPIIRLYDGAKMILHGYNGALKTWELQTCGAERTKARLMSLSGLLSTIPLLLIFLIGGRMAIDRAITVGTLYIFINLSSNVSGVMMNMPGFIASFRQFSVNMKRLTPNISL